MVQRFFGHHVRLRRVAFQGLVSPDCCLDLSDACRRKPVPLPGIEIFLLWQ
jgi:hypothetical protein